MQYPIPPELETVFHKLAYTRRLDLDEVQLLEPNDRALFLLCKLKRYEHKPLVNTRRSRTCESGVVALRELFPTAPPIELGKFVQELEDLGWVTVDSQERLTIKESDALVTLMLALTAFEEGVSVVVATGGRYSCR